MSKSNNSQPKSIQEEECEEMYNYHFIEIADDDDDEDMFLPLPPQNGKKEGISQGNKDAYIKFLETEMERQKQRADNLELQCLDFQKETLETKQKLLKYKGQYRDLTKQNLQYKETIYQQQTEYTQITQSNERLNQEIQMYRYQNEKLQKELLERENAIMDSVVQKRQETHQSMSKRVLGKMTTISNRFHGASSSVATQKKGTKTVQCGNSKCCQNGGYINEKKESCITLKSCGHKVHNKCYDTSTKCKICNQKMQ